MECLPLSSTPKGAILGENHTEFGARCEMRYANEALPSIDGNPLRLRSNFPEITNEEFWQFYERCMPYSLLQVPGFYNLYQSVCHVARNQIQGDFVECGCLFGGASIFAYLAMRSKGLKRKIYLFDTFEGIDEVGPLVNGEVLNHGQIPSYYENVKLNITECGCDLNDFVLIGGKVEETLSANTIDKIAILRLDTDFYSSTRFELEYLYPNLVPGGALIIDDYGVFQGSRDATDEYLAKLDCAPLLNRIDSAVWAGVKPF
jgi:O-methyltransferase